MTTDDVMPWAGHGGVGDVTTRVVYNLRKLSELPHHLVQGGMRKELYTHVLFSYAWLHAKLSATSLHDVLSDFHQASRIHGCCF